MNNFQKQTVTKIQKPNSPRPKAHASDLPAASPREVKFLPNTGQTGRTLRFTDNLLHEDMNLGDVGEASFDSPGRGPSQLVKSTMFTEVDPFVEEPTAVLFLPPQFKQENIVPQEEEPRVSSDDQLLEPSLPLFNPAETVSPSNKDDGGTPETPSTRQRRIKVNREVEKIVVSQQSRCSNRCFSQP